MEQEHEALAEYPVEPTDNWLTRKIKQTDFRELVFNNFKTQFKGAVLIPAINYASIHKFGESLIPSEVQLGQLGAFAITSAIHMAFPPHPLEQVNSEILGTDVQTPH
jgi:hypothetical protein